MSLHIVWCSVCLLQWAFKSAERSETCVWLLLQLLLLETHKKKATAKNALLAQQTPKPPILMKVEDKELAVFAVHLLKPLSRKD